MHFHCVVHRILSTALQGCRLGLISSFHSKPREVNSVAPSCTAGRCIQPLKTKCFFYDAILLLSGKSEGNLKNPRSSNINSLPPVPSTADRSEHTPSRPSCCPPILPAGIPSSVFLLSPSPTTRQHAVEQSSSTGYHWPLGPFFILQGYPPGHSLSWIPATKLQ